jgi:hypothetical protein
MGEWSCWRAVLRARSPVHIGWHRLGLIERTRYYLPARTIWGMLVAGLAQRLGGRDLYDSARKQAAADLRFTCFFPCGGEEASEEIWRPKYREGKKDEEGGLYYGPYKAAEMERDWVFSQASTAIDPGANAAEQGALHETEYLRPERPGRLLHFVGFVFCRGAEIASLLPDVLALCQAGGERKRGWGRLSLAKWETPSGPVFGEFAVEEEGAELALRVEKNYTLPAHLLCKPGQEGFSGDLEVIAGRDWSAAGPGRKVAQAKACWAPGTLGTSEAVPARFRIDEEGVWEMLARACVCANG